jgi:hypothetical protein
VKTAWLGVNVRSATGSLVAMTSRAALDRSSPANLIVSDITILNVLNSFAIPPSTIRGETLSRREGSRSGSGNGNPPAVLQTILREDTK